MPPPTCEPFGDDPCTFGAAVGPTFCPCYVTTGDASATFLKDFVAGTETDVINAAVEKNVCDYDSADEGFSMQVDGAADNFDFPSWKVASEAEGGFQWDCQSQYHSGYNDTTKNNYSPGNGIQARDIGLQEGCCCAKLIRDAVDTYYSDGPLGNATCYE